MNSITCFLFSAKQNLVVVEVNLRTPAWRIVEKAVCLFDIEVICLISRFPAVEFGLGIFRERIPSQQLNFAHSSTKNLSCKCLYHHKFKSFFV